MTSTYKRFDQIDPDLFRNLILGSRDEVPAQEQTGIMSPTLGLSGMPNTRPQPRPEGLGLRNIDTTPALEETLLGDVARNMGENAIDRQRVANAVVPTPQAPQEIDLSEWESMRPISEIIGRSQTEQAIPTLPSSRNATPPLQMPLTGIDFTAGAQPVAQEEEPAAATSNGVSTLLDFISTGEGTYDSYNSGTVNDVIQHWSHEYVQDGTNLSSMTIGQIREKMDINDPTNPDRIFAAGRYQVIPSTLDAAVEALGLSDDTIFNQETQDQIGLYLVSEKRPRVGAYLAGEDVSVETAMLDLAREFASFPVPRDIQAGTYGSWPKRDIQAGESFYAPAESRAGTNRASHTVEETRSLLESIRGN